MPLKISKNPQHYECAGLMFQSCKNEPIYSVEVTDQITHWNENLCAECFTSFLGYISLDEETIIITIPWKKINWDKYDMGFIDVLEKQKFIGVD
jgi:hypothetical protein